MVPAGLLYQRLSKSCVVGLSPAARTPGRDVVQQSAWICKIPVGGCRAVTRTFSFWGRSVSRSAGRRILDGLEAVVSRRCLGESCSDAGPAVFAAGLARSA